MKMQESLFLQLFSLPLPLSLTKGGSCVQADKGRQDWRQDCVARERESGKGMRCLVAVASSISLCVAWLLRLWTPDRQPECGKPHMHLSSVSLSPSSLDPLMFKQFFRHAHCSRCSFLLPLFAESSYTPLLFVSHSFTPFLRDVSVDA